MKLRPFWEFPLDIFKAAVAVILVLLVAS